MYDNAHLQVDNNASLHIIATSLQRVAESLEELCQISSNRNGGTTHDPLFVSFPTASPTSWRNSPTKPANTTARSAEAASTSENSPTSTVTETTYAKTAVMSALELLIRTPWLDDLWVETMNPGEATLVRRSNVLDFDEPTEVTKVDDAWTLASLLEAVRDTHQWEPET